MCFQCVDTLLFASNHAKGMSLRYDAILALSDNLISEDWFFAEGDRFFSTDPTLYIKRILKSKTLI